MARVVLAMSGGVDSSAAAHLLLEAGHEVIGVFMRHGEESAAACDVPSGPAGGGLPVVTSVNRTRADHKQGCCTASDAADARRVAGMLGIPFYALDLQADFRRIVDYFVEDYLSGRTPNPCVRCNQWIKFGRLFDYAAGVDAEYVATGHYARMVDGHLHRGLDDRKDQSYALFGIERRRLNKMLLPVGEFEKPRIRELAESIGLAVADKRDSQEICFVTQGHHSEFVKGRAPVRSLNTGGDFVLTDGTVVGQHAGYEAFTVGQRKGLGIALGSPHFVVRIEPETQRVVLGKRDELEGMQLFAEEANWLVPIEDLPRQCEIQIRYNGSPKPGTLNIAPDGQTFDFCFDEPESAIAPGQAAVLYDNAKVLGGGWIRSGESR